MGSYSIRDLENLSGIKAHTIRIWEKRYKLITPKRTKTNIRSYNDDDLKKILNVSILNNLGLKISKIVQFSGEELCNKVLELTKEEGNVNTDVDKLILGMVELNEARFEKLFSTFILKYGFEKAMLDLIYPFLEKIGILWQTGNIKPAHEHFISNLIRQKLMVAIDGLPNDDNSPDQTFILFLNEGELHELGLLFYNYLLRKKGFSTFYLGQSVPKSDLLSITNTIQAKYLVTAFVSAQMENSINQIISDLSSTFPQKILLVTGKQVEKHTLLSHKNVILFKNVVDLQAFIDTIP